MNILKIFKNAVISLIFLILGFIFVRKVMPSDIIFYQGLLWLLMFAASCLIGSFTLHKIKIIDFNSFHEQILSLVIASLLFYSFHITIPSLLDRSISLYIIGITEKKENSTITDYREQFYQGFIIKNEAVEKRLNEQIVTGNIKCKQGKCTLTDKGRNIYKLNNWLANIFNVDDKYINPAIYSGE